MQTHRQQLNNTKKAILITLIYSDIFEFPLTDQEISEYLLSFNTKKIPSGLLNESLNKLVKGKKITKKESFYCLFGREHLIAKRHIRDFITKQKLSKSKRAISFLQIIPTIQLLGFSGSVAMNNAKEIDDIDLFIITRKHTLWITRLVVLFILQLLGVRRSRESQKVHDTICANMFIDEKNLCLLSKKQNIYTAHEVIQMKPVFLRNNSYRRFLQNNVWIRNYFVYSNLLKKQAKVLHSKNISAKLLSFLELPAKIMQLNYMKNHRTFEIIEEAYLAFHPNDQQERILAEFEKRKKRYGL